MILENTEDNQEPKRVSATMAIENMFLSRDFINEMLKVSSGEKTTDELRKEVIKKYAR